MRRTLGMLISLAMLASLCAYAIAGVKSTSVPASRRMAAPVGEGRQNQALRPLRELRSAELPQADAESVARRQKALDDAAQEREAAIIAQLGLSAEQMSKYSELMAVIAAERDVMMSQPDGHLARGLAINRMLHDGLRDVFTSGQYETYLDLWNDQGDMYGTVDPGDRRGASP